MSRMNEGSPILQAQNIRVANQPFRLTGHQQPGHQPVVTIKRDGEIIREIQINCGCGETIILDCDYGTQSATPFQPPVHQVSTPQFPTTQIPTPQFAPGHTNLTSTPSFGQNS